MWVALLVARRDPGSFRADIGPAVSHAAKRAAPEGTACHPSGANSDAAALNPLCYHGSGDRHTRCPRCGIDLEGKVSVWKELAFLIQTWVGA